MPFYAEHQMIFRIELFVFYPYPYLLVLISFPYWLTIGQLRMFYVIKDDLEKLNVILFSLA